MEKVRERLYRATAALDHSGVPYAVVGGNAVALWVSRVDESAVRNTQDVNLLIHRADFDAARASLESVGFVYRHAARLDLFLDGPDAKSRDAVHLIFAGEKVRPHEALPNPDVTESERAEVVGETDGGLGSSGARAATEGTGETAGRGETGVGGARGTGGAGGTSGVRRGFTVLALPALVRIKLTAFRDKDRTHLRDLIEVGLLGPGDLATLPPPLADRLRQILETPDG